MTMIQDFARQRGNVPVARLLVTRLTAEAVLPSYGSDGSAGLDLSADLTRMQNLGTRYTLGDSEHHYTTDKVVRLSPGERRVVKTGIAISIPRGNYGRVAPRSGLAVKQGVDVMAGVIDEDYIGEVGVVLVNLGDTDVEIGQGDRIAQLVIERYTPCLVEEVDALAETERGAGGFGSTGT